MSKQVSKQPPPKKEKSPLEFDLLEELGGVFDAIFDGPKEAVKEPEEDPKVKEPEDETTKEEKLNANGITINFGNLFGKPKSGSKPIAPPKKEGKAPGKQDPEPKPDDE